MPDPTSQAATAGDGGFNPIVLRTKGPSRDSMLSEMGKLDDAKPAMKIVTPASELADARKGAAAATRTVEASPIEVPAEEDPIRAELAADADDAPDEPVPVSARPDRETEKRLDVVRKAEKRAKEEMASARAEHARDVAAHAERVRSIDAREARLKELAASAKSDPWPLLAELGVTDEDAEHVSRAIYANSKAAAADPKNRAAVDAAIRTRKEGDRLSRLERELADTRSELSKRDQATEHARIVNEHIDGVAKAATDEHPLFKRMLTKNPTKARNALGTITQELIVRDGEVPDHEDVLAEFEKRRGDELRELDIDPTTFASKPAAATAAPVTTTTAAKSRTLGAGGSATASPRAKTAATMREEIVRALEEDKLEF